jgi:hypothetical protein
MIAGGFVEATVKLLTSLAGLDAVHNRVRVVPVKSIAATIKLGERFDFRQPHTIARTFHPLSAALRRPGISGASAGQEGVGVPNRGTPPGSRLDLLDHDRMGQSGKHAWVHDLGGAQKGDAAPDELVR